MLPKSFEMLLTKRLIVGSQYGILFARAGEEYGSSQCENYEQPDERRSPVKEKTYHTRCGTIHYWVSVSDPDTVQTNPNR